MNHEETQRNKINLAHSPETLKGRYATNVFLAATKEEVILDFVAMNPVQRNGSVIDRIYISHKHTTRLIDALKRVLEQSKKNPDSKSAAQTQPEIGFKTD